MGTGKEKVLWLDYTAGVAIQIGLINWNLPERILSCLSRYSMVTSNLTQPPSHHLNKNICWCKGHVKKGAFGKLVKRIHSYSPVKWEELSYK